MGRKPTKNLNLPRGMRARKQRSGRTFYYYDTGAQPRREIPLGADYVEAVRKWAELEADQHAPHSKLITFRYVAERYVAEVLPKKAPRTREDNLDELASLYRFFDDPPVPLGEIKPVHVRQYLTWRVDETRKRLLEQNELRVKAGRAPLAVQAEPGKVRANREKALLSHIWNFAREKGFTDLVNPCQGIKGHRETGRDTYVDDETYQAVWQAADGPTRDALDLAYLTGQRPADTLKMTRADLRDGAVWVVQNKTGQKLRIAIEGELAAVIERIRGRHYAATPLALVVNEKGKPLTASALRGRFDKARDAAVRMATGDPALVKNIKAFQFRDLRAKAGTDTEEAGGIAAAKDQLGHTSEAMTKHYVRHRKGKLVRPTK